jgi:hypothetical protein
MDLDKLRELAGLSKPVKSTLKEHVVGDLNNGYDLQHSATKFHSDFFPTGADSNVADEAGPASAKQGDNPMQKSIKIKKDELGESKEIHSQLVYEYRKFKSGTTIKESPEDRAALITRYNSGDASHEELSGHGDIDPSYAEMLRRRKEQVSKDNAQNAFEKSPEGVAIKNAIRHYIDNSFNDDMGPSNPGFWITNIMRRLKLKSMEDFENNLDAIDELLIDYAEKEEQANEFRGYMD